MRVLLRNALLAAALFASTVGLLACGDADASAPTVKVGVDSEGIQIPDGLSPGFTTFPHRGDG